MLWINKSSIGKERLEMGWDIYSNLQYDGQIRPH